MKHLVLCRIEHHGYHRGVGAPRSPWQNAFAERVIGSIRRDCLKLFLHITPDEQLRRFRDRLIDPVKRWKLSYEDFRNRARRSDYETAIEDMMEQTTTKYAPWHLIPANNKPYGRIAVFRIIADRLGKAAGRSGVAGRGRWRSSLVQFRVSSCSCRSLPGNGPGRAGPGGERTGEIYRRGTNSGGRYFELRAATDLARLWVERGERQKAHDLLAPILGWFTEGSDRPDLMDAKACLNAAVT